jgi:hypothetical protein
MSPTKELQRPLHVFPDPLHVIPDLIRDPSTSLSENCLVSARAHGFRLPPE